MAQPRPRSGLYVARLREPRPRYPIGRPISNTQIYILDGSGEPCPIGVAGELYIGGAGVARGYLNRPELTAERFVRNPFVDDPGARMYRTGDLGYWLSDGNIAFVGRNDFQVKIRGFRIELGEIEARLSEHPGIRDAVVVAREDVPGDKRLVAYFTTTSEGQGTVSAEQLRSHLSSCVPEYMVPAAYVRVEEFPLTPNGKLNRKGLPAPDGEAYVTRVYEAPQTENEAVLAAIWQEVLKVDRVGRQDNFFELGGHSLLAVRVVSRLRQVLQVEVAIRDLFAHPVLADLARALVSAVHCELPPVLAADRSAALPLSFAQQRLWFLAQMGGASEVYHIPVCLGLTGALDSTALRVALDCLVSRHEVLRTTFVMVDGQPTQRIAGTDQSRFLLIEHDLRQHSDVGVEFDRLRELEAGTAFDLEQGPLIRGRLIRLGEDEHALLITMHHIVSDGWSMGIIWNELSVLYSAFLEGRKDPLPKLEIQYADYAVWQRQWIEGEVLREQAGYWKGALADAPALLELPADHPRPAEQDFAGSFAELVLDEGLTAGLKELSRRNGTTLFMTLLAAWAALLGRLSGQQDVVIGTPTANRGRAEIENLIGFFINTLALRLDLSGSPTVAELLRKAKAQAIAAQQHQDIPFEQVVELLQPVRSLSHSPLFQVMFAWQNVTEGELELPGIELLPLPSSPHRVSKFDLGLSLQESGNVIVGGIEYATALFEASTIERYLDYFRKLLAAMVADDTQIVDRLSILSDAERQQLLYGWNDTGREYPSEQCIHQLFEEQVERTPSATAVVFEDQSLSYAELNERSNRLAHHLRTLGVKPDTRVAICVERSLEMMVGLLAILKAGGAYVPLDPAYPVERLRFMLQDSAPVALLTQEHLVGLFADVAEVLPVLDLGVATPPWDEMPVSNPDPGAVGLTSRHLAYIIYTSGSTGMPKGVQIAHSHIINFFGGMNDRLPCGPEDVILAVTGISFDISVLELFWTLTKGIKIVLVAPFTADHVETVPYRPVEQIEYSLFYFSSADNGRRHDKYRLLLEGAKFADENGFAAIWTPERHFHAFGGLFPNPAVTAAAIATITTRVQIRAGSVVLPLHNVIRVAEEWSVVDNLSNGRVGIAFASGWHPNDFVFTPENYAARREITVNSIKDFVTLWRGGSLKAQSGDGKEIDVRVYPRPLQERPPIWVTAAGTDTTFQNAGAMGLNILTHLLGQTIEELSHKISVYREALAQHGHDPQARKVTLMLHTFLGQDKKKVKNLVKEPFIEYLRSSLDLTKTTTAPGTVDTLSKRDVEELLASSFERYFEEGALFGTVQSCVPMINRLKEIGVNEIACLIDFGLNNDEVLGGLRSHSCVSRDHESSTSRKAYNFA